MTISSHERYRDQLTRLSADAAILPAVSAAGALRGWWKSDRSWRRTYGRFTPEGAAFAEMVFASDSPSSELCRVQIFAGRPQDPNARDDVSVIESEVGWARLTRFPFDPGLPGLVHVVRASGASITVERYQPGRRCTVRMVNGSRTLFAKVYATNKGARVYRELVDLWRAASEGELQFATAVPLAWDRTTRTLSQSALTGRPATESLRGDRGDDLARRIGCAAASLTRATVRPAAISGSAAQLIRSRRRAGELVARVPRLAETVAAIMRRLEELHARYSSRRRGPAHGAPHPTQWLVDGTAIGLIDFDRFSWGDPEMDAGIFLGDLDSLDAPAISVERLAAAFLDGYRGVGVVLCAPLVQAYRADQQLAKALRSAQAIRADGDRRAAKHVAVVEETLNAAVSV